MSGPQAPRVALSIRPRHRAQAQSLGLTFPAGVRRALLAVPRHQFAAADADPAAAYAEQSTIVTKRDDRGHADQLPAAVYPIDVTAGITDWQMLGNGPDPTCTKDPNGVGDCTFAGRQHYRMAKAAAEAETETWASSNALVTEYLAYDHGKDQGAQIADLLLYWYKAATILAFAPVDHTNPAEIDTAMAAFHGVYVGVNLTDDADQLFGRQQPWTTANGQRPDPSDGHCIVKVKADGAQYDAWVTWGAVQQSTLAWTAACLDEAWVIITQEDAAAGAVNLAALRADIDALKGPQRGMWVGAGADAL